MRFKETRLKDACMVEPERMRDERGFFARAWCEREFRLKGINFRTVQCSISFSRHAGTLRGMHFQVAPYEEAKIVRCTKGAVYDVFIDLRPGSETYKKWDSAELTEENRRMVYIPKGFAHGFLTLLPDTEVFYQMSEFYAPGYARGVRWNDPAFGIAWPDLVKVISERDRLYQDFQSIECQLI